LLLCTCFNLNPLIKPHLLSSLAVLSLAEHLLGGLLKLTTPLVVQLRRLLLPDSRTSGFTRARLVCLAILLLWAAVHSTSYLSDGTDALVLLLSQNLLLLVEAGSHVASWLCLVGVLDGCWLLSNDV
jgi:hypothetical protein